MGDAAAVFAERVLGVLAGYAGPVRCRQVVEGLGLEMTARNVERVRHHLKRAAAAGSSWSTATTTSWSASSKQRPSTGSPSTSSWNVHVLEHLWKAAEDLHPAQPGRAAFVQYTARDLLEGHAPRVIADLNAHLRARAEVDHPTRRLQRAAACLSAKQPYLNYHSPWAGRSPPASSRAAAATWSRTASM